MPTQQEKELRKWRSGEYGPLSPLMQNVLYCLAKDVLTVEEAVERLVALRKVEHD
jgi:hypothetical protein